MDKLFSFILRFIEYLVLGIISIWLLFLISIFFYKLAETYSKYYFKLLGRMNLIYLFFPFPLFFRKKFVQKNKEYLPNKKHIAIILANGYFPEKYLIYTMHIPKIINYLKGNKKPYKVYEGLSSNQIKSIINNKKVKGVILCGHGSKHSIQTGINETLYYCEFKNSPKKDFIAQFHCNHLNGKPLSEYISKKDTLCFIRDGLQRTSDINNQINKIVKDKLL